jgi:hypothetical protein
MKRDLFDLLPFSLITGLMALVITLPGCRISPNPLDSEVVSLKTQDGFELSFDVGLHKFSYLSLPGFAVDLLTEPDLGVYLYDPKGMVLLNPYNIRVESYEVIDGSLHVIRESASKEIKTEEIWTAYDSHIELETIVTAHTEETTNSKAIEACVQLPLHFTGMQWHHNLHLAERIQSRSKPYETLLTNLVDIGSFGDGSYHLKSDLDFNLYGINLIGDDSFGFAIALHPEKPAAYYVRYDTIRKSYDACFHLGLYKYHLENRNSISFSLVFFAPNNPEYGLRSALHKYISIYPDSFEGNLGSQSGMVVGGEYSYDEYPDPNDFHIQAMWNGYKSENIDYGVISLTYLWPTGWVDRGMRLTTSSNLSNSNQSWETDIASCLSIYRDFDDGNNPFEETCTDLFTRCTKTNNSGRVYGPVSNIGSLYYLHAYQVTITNRPNYLFGQFSIFQPLSISLLIDKTGRHSEAMSSASAMYELDWDPHYRCALFGLNPDPGLEVSPSILGAEEDAPIDTENFGHLNLEIAKRANGLYGNSYIYKHPTEGMSLYNGVAIDNMGFYLRQDFNPRMLRIASMPLSYDKNSGRVVSLEHLNLFAFVKALQASLPQTSALAMNGYPISGILGQDIDFFMTEMLRRNLNGNWVYELYDEDLQTRLRRIDRVRMSAYQRPITFWARFVRASGEQELLEQMRQYLPLYTSNGIYINLQRYGYEGEKYFWRDKPHDEDVLQEYKKHLDAVYALTKAGWEPIPFAKPVDMDGSIVLSEILVERFGNTLFTLYNGGNQELVFNVVIDWRKIGLSTPPTRVWDWETSHDIPFTVSGNTLLVSDLSLANNTVQILSVQ